MNAIIGLLFCVLLGIMLKMQGIMALLWFPIGFVLALFISAQIALPILLGMPRAISLVAKRQMHSGIFIRLLITPIIWFILVFGGLFLIGFLSPSAVASLQSNTSLDLGVSLGTIAIVLSPLSKKSRNDFREDFDRSYAGYLKASESQLFAVKWTEEQLFGMKNTREITVHNLFVGFMYAVSKFSSIPDANSDGDEILAVKLSETGLFEFGCCVYSAVDLWLFKNRPAIRERIADGFYDEFINLYSSIFQMEPPSIGKIFNQRLIIYGEIYRSDGLNIEKLSRTLSQIIMFSNAKTKPEFYDGDLSLEAFKTWHIETTFQSWYIHIFPAYIKALDLALQSLQ